VVWYAPISQTTTVTAPNAGDGVYIGPTVTVSVAGDRGVFMQSSGHHAIIHGTVISTTNVSLRVGGSTAGLGHVIEIGEGGHVASLSDAVYALQAWGSGTTINNAGTIFGLGGGITINADSTTTTTTIINSGTIKAGTIGLINSGAEKMLVLNSGLISSNFTAIEGAGNIDSIGNSGRIEGMVALGGGNDSYSGASGHLIGKLYGEAGADTAIGGTDDDWFDGGSENDTLIGNGGNDTLVGGTGQDKLYGTTGNDTLTGGIGVDYFIFNTTPNAATNRDTVADFVHGGDKFWMENAVFTKLGAAGALNPAFFRLGPAALDADDHIVYDHTTGNLFYDSNGSAAGGVMQFATLTTKPILSAPDFVVI
jgi:Ca2+-binding RTX toxin-like protein